MLSSRFYLVDAFIIFRSNLDYTLSIMEREDFMDSDFSDSGDFLSEKELDFEMEELEKVEEDEVWMADDEMHEVDLEMGEEFNEVEDLSLEDDENFM